MTAPLTLAELNERRLERAQLEADMGRLRKRLAVLTREILSGVALPAPSVADGQLALPTEDRTDMEAAADAGVALAVREHRAPLRSVVLLQLEAANRWRSARVLVALLGGGEREEDVRSVCEALVAEGLAARKQGAYKLAEKVKKKGGKGKGKPPPPPAPAKPDLSADVRPPVCGWEEAIDLTIRLLVERDEEGTRAGEVEKATTRRSSTEAPRVVLDAYCAARVLVLLDSADVAACSDDGLSTYTPSIHLDGKRERERIASAHKLLADYLTGLVEDSDPQTSGELARVLEVPEGLVVAALERIPRGAVWRDDDGRWHPKPKPSTRRVKAKSQGTAVAAEGSAG